MQTLLLIILAITLSLLAYQDLRYRAVSWIIFPIMVTAGVWHFYLIEKNIEVVLWNIAVNLVFLILQLLLLILFFYIKEKQIVRLPDNKIGWGDLLFLATSACMLPFNYFVPFYTISLILSLLLFLLASRIISANTIPLAGIQAIFLALFIISREILIPNLPAYDRFFHY